MSTAREHFRRWATALLGHDAEVYQYSTIGALLDGVYDGDATVADILQHGDFGLGTFNHLDGEMVILDGVCYRLRADGTATRAAPTDRTPFAAITRFHRDFGIAIAERTDRAAVTAAIDQRITSTNLIYAIRVTGHFADLHTRTVMEQQQPYPPLTQATEGQAETRFTDVSGTLVGCTPTSNKASPSRVITCTSSTTTAPPAATSSTSPWSAAMSPSAGPHSCTSACRRPAHSCRRGWPRTTWAIRSRRLKVISGCCTEVV